MPLRNFFQKYDRLVLFDTETTGLAYNRDEIIEFAAVVVELVDGKPTITTEYDELVQLAPGSLIPPKIQQLTGIFDLHLIEIFDQRDFHGVLEHPAKIVLGHEEGICNLPNGRDLGKIPIDVLYHRADIVIFDFLTAAVAQSQQQKSQ